jgi:L-iditol 2-dehydrogenase
MKAFTLSGIREMALIDIPEPAIAGDHEVKIKMSAVGVCGSDIHYYLHGRIGSQVVQYPFVVGHEGSGIVVETGAKVTRVKTGDLVAIDPAMPCWECDQCVSGRPHTCRHLKFLGCPGQAEGCLRELIIMPEESCFAVPPYMDAMKAAVSEPLSIGVYAVQKAVLSKKCKIGILGSGPIGMSVLYAAVASGVGKIYVTDLIDERLALARKEGALWTGNPGKINVLKEIPAREPLLLDVIFECCGKQEAFDQAIELLKPGGKIVLVGIPEFDRWTMSADLIRRKEILLQNIRRQVDCVEASFELFSGDHVNPGNMVTHHFSFADTSEAFELVASYGDGVMKAMIEF